MTSIAVGTADLRRALKAVAPHSSTDANLPQICRVRLDIGPVNLTLSATNRYTAGYAIVSIESNQHGDICAFDLSPLDVKEIVGLFKGATGKNDDDPDDTLMLELDEEHLKVTDISGLFPGKALTLPRYPTEENYPDIGAVIAQILTSDNGGAARLITAGSMLGLFTKAALSYGEPLVIEPTGGKGAMLLSCGDSFVGVLMPVTQTDEKTAEIDAWHSDWVTRLGDLAAGYAPKAGA